jgi:hypothetical protein
LAIICKSPTSGYYVDIVRSDNKVSNDYVYHNIGENVTFLNGKREPLTTFEATYPVTEKDYPGFRFFTDVRKLESCTGNVLARFPVKDGKSDDLFLQALIAGGKDRVYYNAFSPKSKSAGQIYTGKPLPLFTIRTEKEAQTNPFVVVFEPYKGVQGNTVENIAVLNENDKDVFTMLEVTSKDKSKEIIFQSVDTAKRYAGKNWAFKGSFGVVSQINNQTAALYLGCGRELSYDKLCIRTTSPGASVSVIVKGKKLIVSSNSAIIISKVNGKTIKYQTNVNLEGNIQVASMGKGSVVKLPAVMNAEVEIQ